VVVGSKWLLARRATSRNALIWIAVTAIVATVACNWTAAKNSSQGSGHSWSRTHVPPRYRYSVVPGGVHSAKEFDTAVVDDQLVRSHYSGVNAHDLRLVKNTEAKLAYVSYRKNGAIYWTRTRVTIPENDDLMIAGREIIRSRCGNRVSYTARSPVIPSKQDEPSESDLETHEQGGSGSSDKPEAPATRSESTVPVLSRRPAPPSFPSQPRHGAAAVGTVPPGGISAASPPGATSKSPPAGAGIPSLPPAAGAGTPSLPPPGGSGAVPGSPNDSGRTGGCDTDPCSTATGGPPQPAVPGGSPALLGVPLNPGEDVAGLSPIDGVLWPPATELPLAPEIETPIPDSVLFDTRDPITGRGSNPENPDVVPTPEPETWILLATTVVGVVGLHERRSRQHGNRKGR
jgi:hypothetical protein